MSLVINHNLMASQVAGNLQNSYARMGSSIERLSTGLRINSAADDAAGLAIREGMRAEIATMSQGVRNAQDGVSLIQTAEGALSIIDEKLIRMKELAEQAATGTYSNDQRMIIQSEFAAMAAEIDRIATATDFNGLKLLNGGVSSSGTGGNWSSHNVWGNTEESNWVNSSGWIEANGRVTANGGITGGFKIHFGPDNDRAEDYYFVRIADVRTGSLFARTGEAFGDAKVAVSTQHAAQLALEQLNTAISRKENVRANLGAIQNRLENTISSLTTKVENLQASESRISDIDVATEMTEFVRNQVLTQAATSMLAQANSLPQMALKLLG